MKVPILDLQWKGRHLLINWIKEVKSKTLKIQIKVLTVVYNIQKLDKFK